MPIPVGPMKVTCNSCGWNKAIPTQGDVIFKPVQCEQCGSQDLVESKGDLIDALSNIGSLIRSVLKK
jgi:peptide subunit release factor 1 (eRF1)